jgi:hypothetical protein
VHTLDLFYVRLSMVSKTGIRGALIGMEKSIFFLRASIFQINEIPGGIVEAAIAVGRASGIAGKMKGSRKNGTGKKRLALNGLGKTGMNNS